MSEQTEQFERVNSRIGEHVLAFYAQYPVGARFYAGELLDYVTDQVEKVAPSSPTRIMQQLRRNGALNYRVISRSESLYEITPVGHE